MALKHLSQSAFVTTILIFESVAVNFFKLVIG